MYKEKYSRYGWFACQTSAIWKRESKLTKTDRKKFISDGNGFCRRFIFMNRGEWLGCLALHRMFPSHIIIRLGFKEEGDFLVWGVGKVEVKSCFKGSNFYIQDSCFKANKIFLFVSKRGYLLVLGKNFRGFLRRNRSWGGHNLSLFRLYRKFCNSRQVISRLQANYESLLCGKAIFLPCPNSSSPSTPLATGKQA